MILAVLIDVSNNLRKMFSPVAGSLNAGLAVSEFRCYLAVLIDVSNNFRKMFSPVAGSLNAGLAVSELCCCLAVLIDVSNNHRKMFSPVADSLHAGLALSFVAISPVLSMYLTNIGKNTPRHPTSWLPSMPMVNGPLLIEEALSLIHI